MFIKVTNGLAMTFEEDKRFLCVWLLFKVSNFCRCQNTVQNIDQVLLRGDKFFSQCIQLQWSVRQKCVHVRSKLPTAALWSREKREEGVKPNCFMYLSEATSVLHTNHLQYSSPTLGVRAGLSLLFLSRPYCRRFNSCKSGARDGIFSSFLGTLTASSARIRLMQDTVILCNAGTRSARTPLSTRLFTVLYFLVFLFDR